mmetsp:Transcript_12480/g.28526  ORF Transcript_12480/g.28526 Transcript_12480/m.28526 type:complete len:213 (+) Transcript_12480:106-744(+)
MPHTHYHILVSQLALLDDVTEPVAPVYESGDALKAHVGVVQHRLEARRQTAERLLLVVETSRQAIPEKREIHEGDRDLGQPRGGGQHGAAWPHTEGYAPRIVDADETLATLGELPPKAPQEGLHLVPLAARAEGSRLGQQPSLNLEGVECAGQVLRQVAIRLHVDAAADDGADVELEAIPRIDRILDVHGSPEDYVVVQNHRHHATLHVRLG